jgi:hypothetical protein
MSKATGLGAGLFVNGVDLSGDTGNVSAIGSSRPTQNVTGIDKSAIERIQLRKNGRIDWGAHWNPTGAHPTLSALPMTDVPVTYVHRQALGAPAACMVGKQINYDGNRSAEGEFNLSVLAQSNGYGLEWGELLTAGKHTEAGVDAGTGVDFGASTAFGLQAYLHVFAFTGTDATINLQSSSDDAVGDPYAPVTGAAFAQITGAPGSQRLQTARDATIERWLRWNITTSGGFSNLVFAVMVVKNEQEVLF